MSRYNEDRHPFDEGILIEDLDKEFPDVKPDDKPAGLDPSTIRLDGDKVPENVRGMTVDALLADRSRMEQLMAQMAAGMNRPAAPVAPAPEPEPTYDRAAIKALIDEGNMVEAMEAMLGFAYKRVTRDFEDRIRPLANTTVTVAEQAMRARYPDEFELFGSEISALAQQAGTTLSTPEAWEGLIGYVRGKGSNFDKLVEYKTTKRRRDSDVVPPSVSAGALRGGNSGSSSGGLKPTKDELASDPAVQKALRASGMTLDEYMRWF